MNEEDILADDVKYWKGLIEAMVNNCKSRGGTGVGFDVRRMRDDVAREIIYWLVSENMTVGRVDGNREMWKICW